MKATEKYYSVAEASLLLSCCGKTIVSRLKAGDFGQEVVDLGLGGASHDYRIPASGLNAFLAARRVFSEAVGMNGRELATLSKKSGRSD